MLNYPKSLVGAKPIAGGKGGNCPDCPKGRYVLARYISNI